MCDWITTNAQALFPLVPSVLHPSPYDHFTCPVDFSFSLSLFLPTLRFLLFAVCMELFPFSCHIQPSLSLPFPFFEVYCLYFTDGVLCTRCLSVSDPTSVIRLVFRSLSLSYLSSLSSTLLYLASLSQHATNQYPGRAPCWQAVEGACCSVMAWMISPSQIL